MKKALPADIITALNRVLDQIETDGYALHQKGIAAEIKIGPGALSEMVNNKRNISFALLSGLYKRFDVNINYIISGGKGSIYIDELEGLILEDGGNYSRYGAQFKNLYEEIKELKERIQDKDTIIQLMKKGKEKDAANLNEAENNH